MTRPVLPHRRRGRVAAAGRVVAAVVLVCAAAVAAAHRAAAHTVAPGVRNVVDGLSPAVPGLRVTVRHSIADELVLTNRSAGTVVVEAATGEPFLRVTPTSVEGNTNAVAWYAAESVAFNPITSVSGVNPAAGTRWTKVGDSGTWAWFDPRLRPDQPADAVPASLAHSPRPVRLANWTVTLDAGGRSVTVNGHREYRPVEGAYEQRLDSPANPAPGVTVAVVGGSTVPAVYVDNESSMTVEVEGSGGEPFLRIGPSGSQANVASPTWLLTGAARDEAPTGLVAAGAAPRWEQVSGDHQFSWIDERGAAPGLDPPSGAGARGPAVAVRRWALPLRIGATRTTITSSVLWQPVTPGPAPSRAVPARALAIAARVGGVVAVAATLMWSRRRRRRRPPSDPGEP